MYACLIALLPLASLTVTTLIEAKSDLKTKQFISLLLHFLFESF